MKIFRVFDIDDYNFVSFTADGVFLCTKLAEREVHVVE